MKNDAATRWIAGVLGAFCLWASSCAMYDAIYAKEGEVAARYDSRGEVVATKIAYGAELREDRIITSAVCGFLTVCLAWVSLKSKKG